MRIPLISRLCCVSAVSLSLTACGAGTFGSTGPATPPALTPPTTLTGNWLLAGSRVPAAYPVVSTSLFVEGNVITGEASIANECAGAVFTGVSSSGFPIRGTIANNGSFQASSELLGGAPLGTLSLTLTGNSPVSGASTWAGSYSLSVTPGSSGGCGYSQSAMFVASPIAAVTGTYVGVPANFGTLQEALGPNAVVSVQITQGVPTLVTRGNMSAYPIPLTASITIANSPCALSASTVAAAAPSTIGGDRFSLAFLTTGSPGEAFLNGTLDDTSAKSFLGDLTMLANANGCQGIALYEFTRK